MSGQIHILGPQAPTANLPKVLDEHAPEGPLAVISAGWRVDESELDALARGTGRQLFQIPIYQWFEDLGALEPELAGLHRIRQKKIKAYKKVYRRFLHSALADWLKISEWNAQKPSVFGEAEEEACNRVREIDRRCLEELEKIRADFSALQHPWMHDSAAPSHDQIGRIISDSAGVIITGGHVAVLRNRMKFFGVEHLLQDCLDEGGNIYCWSAGAMTLTDQIVLYYDNPPEGVGHPELLDTGLGLVPDTILLPHASRRLNLRDNQRVERFARRFSRQTCICLENGAHLVYDRNKLRDLSEPRCAFRLTEDGTKLALEAS